MTEVIRVVKDQKAGESATDNSGQPDSESPQTSEVIRVGKGPANDRSIAGESGRTDHERGRLTEVRKVVRHPGRDDPPEKSLRATEEIAGSTGIEGAAGQALNVPGDLADIAAVFVDSLKALDAVAAEQAKLLVGIAVCLAEAARSPGRGEFGRRGPGIKSGDLEADTLVASVKQAADSQMKAFDVAQGRLAELTADLKSDSRPHAGSLLSADPYAPIGAALANMVSNLNLAQQNAIANQQAMNSIAQAAIAAGLKLLYATARPAMSREG